MVAVVCLGLSIPVAAAFSDVGVPVALKLCAASLLAVTAVRPAWGLLILAGCLPLATPLRDLAMAPPPLGGNEAAELLVAPVVVAAGLRLALGPPLARSRLSRPAVAFAAIVTVSGLLQLFGEEQLTGHAGAYLADLTAHLFTRYFDDPQTHTAAHIILACLEAVGLAVIVERCLRQSPGLGATLVRGWLLGAAGAASMSIARLLEISLRQPDSGIALVHFLAHQRIAPLVSDVNAAGSYFALCAVPAVWCAMRRRGAWLWLVAAVVLSALWMAGSRAALAGSVIGLATAWLLDRRPAPGRALAAGLLTLAVAWGATWNPGRFQASSEYAAGVRIEMARIGLRIAAEHPFFGVGVGGFRLASLPFVTPDFIARFPPAAVGENAHNNFIQVLAETGLFGLGALLALLAVPLAGALRTSRAGAASVELTAMTGGLVAFLVTWLAGHPLLIQQVFYQFFLALGIAAGLLAAPAPGRAPKPSRVAADPLWRSGRLWFGAAMAATLCSVPVRAYDVARTVNRSGAVLGASQPLVGQDGQAFRLAEQDSAWFVPASSAVVTLPLRLAMPSEPPCRVDISLDGRPANAVEPTRTGWTRVEIVMPPADGDGSRRIDLHVAAGHCWLMVGPVTRR